MSTRPVYISASGNVITNDNNDDNATFFNTSISSQHFTVAEVSDPIDIFHILQVATTAEVSVVLINLTAALGNGVILWLLYAFDPLRHHANGHLLLSALVHADLILSIGYVISSAQLLVTGAGKNPSNLVCAMLSLPHLVGTTLDELITLAIAVDRMSGVCFPLCRNPQNLRRRAKQMLYAAGAVTLIATCCAFIGFQPNQRALYGGFGSGYNVTFVGLWGISVIGTSYTTCGIYLVTLIKLVQVQKKTGTTSVHPTPQEAAAAAAEQYAAAQQRRTNGLVIALIGSKMITTTFGWTLSLVVVCLIGAIPKALPMLAWVTLLCGSGTLTSCNTLANIIVYPWKCRELNSKLKDLLAGRFRIVVPCTKR